MVSGEEFVDKEVFEKYADLFNELKITPNNGIGDVYTKISGHAMETEVKSPVGGKVSSILVQEGANVQTGDTLILLD